MSTLLTIDEAGRVVLPKQLRDRLNLEAGDALEMDSTGEQITLRPVRSTGDLREEHGVLVFYAGNPISASTTDDLLQRIRDDRDSTNRGADK